MKLVERYFDMDITAWCLLEAAASVSMSTSGTRHQRKPYMENVLAWIVTVLIIVAGLWLFRQSKTGRRMPAALRRGQPLPDFQAADEKGQPVESRSLLGAPAVILFVRGNWCPFCTAQVADLTSHYKEIVDLGSRLIFVTPKPLETTRRVAEFYEVEFDFWLDEELKITKQLDLLHHDGVPGDYHVEYGSETVWPAALVVDAEGMIRFSEVSKTVADRPDSKKLLTELRRFVRS